MVKESSAGAIIFRKEDGKTEYLLLHYIGGHWDFVKGHIENGENDLETLKRETEEETGIKDLKIYPNFKENIHYYFKRGNNTVSKNVHFYIAETKTKEIKLSDEHIGYEWYSYNMALEHVTFKNAKELLKKAQKYITKI